MNYDVIIVGAGPAGIFTAYELIHKKPDLQILLIEKGHNIYSRRCPILEKKISKCPPPAGRKDFSGCLPACSITNGFGGAGAYSDGKFNITTEFGGWMTDYLAPSEVLELIKYVDDINLKHGATPNITDPTTEAVRDIERKGQAVGLKLLRANVRHLGTEQNLEILKSICEELESKITMLFKQEVEDIIVEQTESGKEIRGITCKKGQEYRANKIVIAPGRDGSQWFGEILKKQGLRLSNNQVDVGVRVETTNVVMEEINKHLYEGKFLFKSSTDQIVRSFCSNPSGHVVVENHSGVMAANGHAYKDEKLGSPNTNFALLVSHVFTEPFDKPNEYAKEVSRRANDLSNGSVIVQRFGDIKRGRRSTEKRLKEGFIEPTLKEAVPGDLGLVLPYNTMKSLIEMVEALDHVTPGIASEHTLFYGVEAKFYSARPYLNPHFETEIIGLYAGGDGAGLTRGLAQAGACGVHIARGILRHLS
ncbi:MULTISPECIES: NAD(P)/FAD-dependent oxidoreductase [Brevibacillus]|uniref:NAD(P)/FAD-dependent oxidoreductase n=1 Tax=Brevibacillus TaxID=55080 RepID=UPI000C757C7D|nr:MULTISPECIES: NAD(P)/FAD-dependent oxidoreductase [Brevibacillus]AUM65424.1 FAD-dependent oxidoreductase [Brevibacillus laterosporus]AYK08429.1 NAD(P)/FAD-dependent oxidoreductase [Brevibacillus laterosporus]MBA4531979.1 NAD(P)/FAD-dependent oxidoreductase [Brevibacillus halotolerans]MCR8993532.1 NAD(P)/FAD-dependent oxidoreductase [Brevibacillus laterosporus]MDF9411550.1 NAD(P)/FAD-dependent oxidoreductase [Brevibacillus laterosporus]